MNKIWKVDLRTKHNRFTVKRRKLLTSTLYITLIVFNNPLLIQYFRLNLLLSEVFTKILFVAKLQNTKELSLRPTPDYNVSKKFKPLTTPLLNSNSTVGYEDSSCQMLKLFRLFFKFTLGRATNILSRDFRLKYSLYSSSQFKIAESIDKIFSRWKNFYYLCFNLFYYNVKFITLSNSFFIKEVSSLNWIHFNNSTLQNLWRFIKPLIFFKPGQIVNYGNLLFKKLKFRNLNVSFVVDILYHAKTIYYLKNNNFFIIGLVSSGSRLKTVDLALPINPNSIFSQLFFIRFLVFIKKDVDRYKFRNYKLGWLDLVKRLSVL